jgi:hypothetical protein
MHLQYENVSYYREVYGGNTVEVLCLEDKVELVKMRFVLLLK